MTQLNFLQLCSLAKKNVNEIDCPTAHLWQQDVTDSCIIIDVREDRERFKIAIPNSIHLSRGTIECHIEKVAPDRNKRIVLHCSGGFRSILAAESLQKMGYSNVYSMTGGLQAWMQEGLPLSENTSEL